MEDFDQEKLRRSLKATEATERFVEEVVNMVQPTPAMSVEEVRSMVCEELGKRDPAAAERYETTRNLRVRMSDNLATGIAHLAEDSMAHLNVREGQPIEVIHGGRRVEMKAMIAPPGMRGIMLGTGDMEALDLEEGAKVAVRARETRSG